MAPLTIGKDSEKCEKNDFRLNNSILLCISSVSQSCLTLCDPMDCSTPGFHVLHSPRVCSDSCPLSRWCHPTISSSVVPFSSCLQSFPASGSFPVIWLFTSGGQNIRASTSPSVLPVNIQCWFPLELTHSERNTETKKYNKSLQWIIYNLRVFGRRKTERS